jgi:hypothetical protein
MCATVLYLSYTGLLEPLGQSQVYQYLKALSRDHDILLITFEKPSDLEQEGRVDEMKRELKSHGIVWHPLQYPKTPTVPATLWDISRGVLLGGYLTKFSKKNLSQMKLRGFPAAWISCIMNYGIDDMQELLEGDGVGVVVQRFDEEQNRDDIGNFRNLVGEITSAINASLPSRSTPWKVVSQNTTNYIESYL